MDKVLEYELQDSKRPLILNLKINKILDLKEIFQQYYNENQNITLEVSLILHGEEFPTNIRRTRFCKLSKITLWDVNQSIEFDKLPNDAKLSFSLILNKQLSSPKYLAHCTFNLFDSNFSFKSGPQLLIMWPFIEPNYEVEDFAPSEVDEPFIDKIKTNYFAHNTETPELSIFHKNRNMEACLNQSFFYNQSLPLVFLDATVSLEGVESKLVCLDHPKISTLDKEQHVMMEVRQSHPLYAYYIENNIYNYLFRKNNQNSEFM